MYSSLNADQKDGSNLLVLTKRLNRSKYARKHNTEERNAPLRFAELVSRLCSRAHLGAQYPTSTEWSY